MKHFALNVHTNLVVLLADGDAFLQGGLRYAVANELGVKKDWSSARERHLSTSVRGRQQRRPVPSDQPELTNWIAGSPVHVGTSWEGAYLLGWIGAWRQVGGRRAVADDFVFTGRPEDTLQL